MKGSTLAFLPLVSIPELETWITTWAFNETVHSRSYTHIIRNIYSNPSEIFDGLMEIEPIVNCARDISRYYDELIEYSGWYNMLGAGSHVVNGETITVDEYGRVRAVSGSAGYSTTTGTVTFSIAGASNGYGVRYVSTASPSGGNNGDIWYQI